MTCVFVDLFLAGRVKQICFSVWLRYYLIGRATKMSTKHTQNILGYWKHTRSRLKWILKWYGIIMSLMSSNKAQEHVILASNCNHFIEKHYLSDRIIANNNFAKFEDFGRKMLLIFKKNRHESLKINWSISTPFIFIYVEARSVNRANFFIKAKNKP